MPAPNPQNAVEFLCQQLALHPAGCNPYAERVLRAAVQLADARNDCRTHGPSAHPLTYAAANLGVGITRNIFLASGGATLLGVISGQPGVMFGGFGLFGAGSAMYGYGASFTAKADAARARELDAHAELSVAFRTIAEHAGLNETERSAFGFDLECALNDQRALAELREMTPAPSIHVTALSRF